MLKFKIFNLQSNRIGNWKTMAAAAVRRTKEDRNSITYNVLIYYTVYG
jgi:hypothetical protein